MVCPRELSVPGHVHGVRSQHRTRGCLVAPPFAWLAAEAPQPAHWRCERLGGQAPGQSEPAGSQPNPFAGSARLPTNRLRRERAGHLKRDLVPQDVVTGPRQFVGHSLQRDELRLALVEPADQRIVANREVGRFTERPTERLKSRSGGQA